MPGYLDLGCGRDCLTCTFGCAFLTTSRRPNFSNNVVNFIVLTDSAHALSLRFVPGTQSNPTKKMYLASALMWFGIPILFTDGSFTIAYPI